MSEGNLTSTPPATAASARSEFDDSRNTSNPSPNSNNGFNNNNPAQYNSSIAINNMISNGQNNMPSSLQPGQQSNASVPPLDAASNTSLTQGMVSNTPHGMLNNTPQTQGIPLHSVQGMPTNSAQGLINRAPMPNTMNNTQMPNNTMSSEMPSLSSNQGLVKVNSGGLNGTGTGGPVPVELRKDKRAHHTALERKRRDHIKDKFAVLHKEVPGLQENDKVSRSNILTKATDYIIDLSKKNDEYHDEVERLRRQNLILQQQIDSLETGKIQGIEHEPDHYDGISGMNDQMSDLNYGTSEPGIRPLNEPTLNDIL
ncbi:hypothetical protein SARC_06504 [Sphaeroforma arctica JP610]|uniref:BHLH domain-containing protein n=1 Tax=Sphaeroforma arctica JP610 TaxID=667725 RepID=A0A0L0FX08_9EUKA|nr:hypothetical protein SARC_06504 [Sphaeroforma arctica JP610]KNC81169.1 hypothetical protein SARC_06504 [Sphaeroforma arctica JP610]|eukprot:XP_014155071.1 hypothetical protein SARC_06504 [Sphaeroforma arctica JP610]